ncbi:MAG: hypothetical protein KBA26_14770, partial [Candidatus Delongbacteria bacterium]|nr:hypothetical protein [Candidatus Delongbacteria bacterium]
FCFRFDSGRAFKGIGITMDRTKNIDDGFQALSKMGVNLARIRLRPDFPFQDRIDGESDSSSFRVDDMDSLLASAERSQIYIIIAPDGLVDPPNRRPGLDDSLSFNSFRNSRSAYPDSVNFIKYQSDYRHSLRSILARYGYHSHILAWELWNRDDHHADPSSDRINRLGEVARELKLMDIHHHMITATGISDDSPEILTIPELDFYQFRIDDSDSMVIKQESKIYSESKTIGKARIISGINLHSSRLKDTAGPGSHHAVLLQMLWLGLFTPTPIIPMIIHFDQITASPKLQIAYQSLSHYNQTMFLRDTPLVRIDLKELDQSMEPSADSNRLIIRNLKRGHELFIWVQHPHYVRLISPSGFEFLPIENRVLVTGSFPDGRYRLEWWNPSTGDLISRQEILNHNQPEIYIPVPPVQHDLVGQLIRMGELEF